MNYASEEKDAFDIEIPIQTIGKQDDSKELKLTARTTSESIPVLSEAQFLKRYRVIRTIGQGEFAKVKLTDDLLTGQKVK